MTFALFFGNRGFFPGALMADARKEMAGALRTLGHEVLILDEKATRYGAVETVREGKVYAEFLRRNRGKYDGVIVSLPNFGDETGAVEALQDAGVPILIQAYPDELKKMRPELRRDAFCGKMSLMDVFVQYGVKFSVMPPHVVHPHDRRFTEQVAWFDGVCAVATGMRRMTVGAIGARTTPFKTVRFDELALQKYGITVEALDLSAVFARMEALKETADYKKKAGVLKGYTSWKGVPAGAFDRIVRYAVVLDQIIEEYGLDAVAIRCWVEMQQQWGISPCVVLSELNERGLIAACEVDVNNAVAMFALSRATGNQATCLDWNNNYGDDDDKCILFHCGPVPSGMMTCKGCITDHAILANGVGKGRAFGCNTGRIAPTAFTFSSMLTRDGKLLFYLGEGRFTEDKIAADFFGCAGVAEIPNLQNVLMTIGCAGHRHHVSVSPGRAASAVREAFGNYLGYDVTLV